MTAVADPTTDAPKKGSKKPLLIGLILALAGGGGGFFAVNSGLILSDGTADAAEKNSDSIDHSDDHGDAQQSTSNIAFVPIDPLVISLPRAGNRAHLRFSASLEVNPIHAAEVEAVKPRIVDVLNGYLRAVDIAELDDPAALMKLRGQMLRRVQIVTGEDRIRDLLIMEFVIN